MVDVKRVREHYNELVNNWDWVEFMTALALVERAYTIDSIDDVTDDEIIKLANAIDMFDSVFNYDINYEVDHIINEPREN